MARQRPWLVLTDDVFSWAERGAANGHCDAVVRQLLRCNLRCTGPMLYCLRSKRFRQMSHVSAVRNRLNSRGLHTPRVLSSLPIKTGRATLAGMVAGMNQGLDGVDNSAKIKKPLVFKYTPEDSNL